ncbi:MAG: hypothetical protein FWH03_06025 [Firmicutes bacterium]|nr:hypothetical protein [Bacillota bacterium]
MKEKYKAVYYIFIITLLALAASISAVSILIFVRYYSKVAVLPFVIWVLLLPLAIAILFLLVVLLVILDKNTLISGGYVAFFLLSMLVWFGLKFFNVFVLVLSRVKIPSEVSALVIIDYVLLVLGCIAVICAAVVSRKLKKQQQQNPN